MFVGQYNYTLDNKKRLVIPAKFRISLSEIKSSGDSNLFVTLKNAEHQNLSTKFLEIYPPEVWQKHLDRLSESAETSQEAAWYFRKITSDTELCKLDPQWRILVPSRLINAAELKRNIMIIGSGSHIEVWDMEKWDMVSKWLNNQAPQLEKYIYKKQ
jgi:MraZ protein